MEVENFLSLMYSPQLVRSTAGHEGLHKWIDQPSYTPSVKGDSLILSSFDYDKFLMAWAFDTRRLLAAARETTKAISDAKGSANSTAWLLIKGYYASFYYAHVALRMSRMSLTYTTTLQFIKLRELLDAFNLHSPFNLKTNQYLFEFSETKKEVSISQRSGGDGTHENTWKSLLILMQNALNVGVQIATDDDQIKSLKKLHDRLRQAVTVSERGKYLSSVRNEVQYQQLHGVWPPYGSLLQADYCSRRLREVTSRGTSIDTFDIDAADYATKFFNSALLICWVVEKFIAHAVKKERTSFMTPAIR